MAVYTWAGGSAAWTTAGDWTLNGVATSAIPGSGDDVVISAPGAYTISLGSVAVRSIVIADPAATLFVTSGLAVSGNLASSGAINLASGTQLSVGGTLSSGGAINL